MPQRPGDIPSLVDTYNVAMKATCKVCGKQWYGQPMAVYDAMVKHYYYHIDNGTIVDHPDFVPKREDLPEQLAMFQ